MYPEIGLGARGLVSSLSKTQYRDLRRTNNNEKIDWRQSLQAMEPLHCLHRNPNKHFYSSLTPGNQSPESRNNNYHQNVLAHLKMAVDSRRLSFHRDFD